MDKNLVVQFADGFDSAGDLTNWTVLENKWTVSPKFQPPYNRNRLRCAGGYAVHESTTTHPAGPGVMAFGGFATKDKCFNPGLSGVNVFEITFVDYACRGEFVNQYWCLDGGPGKVEDPIVGRYLMGWGITIGNYTGFVGSKKGRSKDRAVQFHFDWLSKVGLYSYLNRAIIPDDKKRYPRFDHRQFAQIQRGGGDDAPVKPWRSRDDCTVLEVRHHPVGSKGNSGIAGNSSGHRYGIRFSDDGNTVAWMLDGQIMDAHDITGYFSSSPGILDEGIYISIGVGGSYQRNVWRFDDAKVSVSK